MVAARTLALMGIGSSAARGQNRTPQRVGMGIATPPRVWRCTPVRASRPLIFTGVPFADIAAAYGACI